MKKHDEGYALALVLVVLTVICLVALSMMSVSLGNVTRQQTTLQRMEEKYEAQGEIEKVVARLEKVLSGSEILDVIPLSENTIEDACNGTRVTAGELLFDNQKLTVTLTTEVPGSTVQIACTLRICGTAITAHHDLGENTYYNIKIPSVGYDSYTVLHNAAPVSEGGGEA